MPANPGTDSSRGSPSRFLPSSPVITVHTADCPAPADCEIHTPLVPSQRIAPILIPSFRCRRPLRQQLTSNNHASLFSARRLPPFPTPILNSTTIYRSIDFLVQSFKMSDEDRISKPFKFVTGTSSKYPDFLAVPRLAQTEKNSHTK